MAKEARVVQLQRDLMRLEMYDALRALNWMIETMNATNGFARKDGSNYYFHLVDSTQDLLNHGERDEITITACILHDSVEDIEGIEIEYIEAKFGREVSVVVDLVTKKKGIDYKDADGVNIKRYLNAILENLRACKVKTTDRKHNFSTLDSTSEKHELRQVIETEAYFIPFFKEARKRYPQHSNYFHSAKTTIVPHLKRIKKAIEVEEKLKLKLALLEEKSVEQAKHIKALEKKIRSGQS